MRGTILPAIIKVQQHRLHSAPINACAFKIEFGVCTPDKGLSGWCTHNFHWDCSCGCRWFGFIYSRTQHLRGQQHKCRNYLGLKVNQFFIYSIYCLFIQWFLVRVTAARYSLFGFNQISVSVPIQSLHQSWILPGFAGGFIPIQN